jgi:hypothetical protein
MTPDHERTYLVQVLASVEVVAADLQEAKSIALDTVARQCADGRGLFIRAEELR